MQFVYPGFLFALAALSIPILIHLFNFRRFRKIKFTNVRFLKEIKQDTRSRSRLKHLLILLCRLLAVTFLVLAFAQPLLPSKGTAIAGGVKQISVYIDNSFSMEAVGKNGSLIETAKRKAREIANAYEPSDRFQLLTSAFEARHQRIVNRDEFLQLVDEVKSSPAVRNLSEVVLRQRDAFAAELPEKSKLLLYEISDFQKSVTDLEQLKNDSSLQISLVPVSAAGVKNVFVDTCSLATPFVQLNSPNELLVRVRNISNADAANVPLKLFINGAQRALASLSVEANSTTESRLSFTIQQPGWQMASVSITDFPVTFDDSYYFSFEVKDHLSVLSINYNAPSSYLGALYGNDPYFRLNNASVNQVDYSSLSSYNLIVLNNLSEIASGLQQELRKYVNLGGALVVFPAKDIQLMSYQDFYRSLNASPIAGLVEQDDRVTFIEKKDPVFSGVFEKKNIPENTDLPTVKFHYPSPPLARTSGEVLMKLQSGDVFLSSLQVGNGIVYFSASPLDETCTSFPRHALFVPFMLKAAMSGFNTSQGGQPIGTNAIVDLPGIQLTGENILHLVNREEKFDIIPESRMVNNKPSIAIHQQVRQAGNYSLETDGKTLAVVSFNFDRRESLLSCYSQEELLSNVQLAGLHTITLMDGSRELTHSVAELTGGIRLWKYCVWLCLLFLTIEVLLIRLMPAAKPKLSNS